MRVFRLSEVAVAKKSGRLFRPRKAEIPRPKAEIRGEPELFGVGCQLLLRKTQGLLHGLCFHFLVGETTANFELFRSSFVQL